MKITKKNLNNVLKDSGVANIKRRVYNPKTGQTTYPLYRDGNDKPVKGLYGVSHSPMDCFSKSDRKDATEQLICKNLGAVLGLATYDSPLGFGTKPFKIGKDEYTLNFTWRMIHDWSEYESEWLTYTLNKI